MLSLCLFYCKHTRQHGKYTHRHNQMNTLSPGFRQEELRSVLYGDRIHQFTGFPVYSPIVIPYYTLVGFLFVGYNGYN